MAPRKDPAEAEHAAYARELAGTLDAGARDGRYLKLILVAPPRFLGLLRQALSAARRTQVEAEVGHDYTRVEPSELAGLLRSHLRGEG